VIRLLSVFFFCCPLIAIWFPGEEVPVDRLLANATEDLRQHPNDAAREYLAGRLYSLKFSQQKTARVVNGKLADSDDAPRTAPGMLLPEDKKDAEESIAHYRRAAELDPKSALYHFSLAWMMQEYSRHSKEKAALAEGALPEYRLAYHLSLQEDLKKSYRFSALLSEQAGTAVVNILRARKPDPAIQREIAECRAM
jgi:tetratricopeptide (TPR) repeat protein